MSQNKNNRSIHGDGRLVFLHGVAQRIVQAAFVTWMTIAVLAGSVEARIHAVATTTMAADLVRAVGGDAVEVTALMGPGVDPHLYKPTRRDVTALQRADVIFYNGLHLEGRMTDLLEGMAARGRLAFPLAERLPEERLLVPEGYEGAADPHIWFDPMLWAETVPVVVEGLSEADPEHAVDYATRGEKVVEEITALDAWARSRIAELSPDRRVLVTSHDAYNYFGRAYEFQVIGVQGLSTVSEAGLADVVQIVKFIREHDVKAVFFESSVSPRLIKRISDDSGAALGGEIFSDAMGKPGTWEGAGDDRYDVGTYEGMVKHNVNTIVEALR